MPSKVWFVTFDCAHPRRVAEFWAEALSYEIRAPNEDAGEVELWDPKGEGPNLGFMKVPESKIVKNRVHIDLKVQGRLEDEVRRLEDAGAQAIETLQDPPDFVEPARWTVMHDPEGNEFCVIDLDRADRIRVHGSCCRSASTRRPPASGSGTAPWRSRWTSTRP